MRGRIIGHGEKTRYLIDNKEVSEAEFREAFPDKPHAFAGGGSITQWHQPIESMAMAVHPLQIQEAMELDRKRGVPVEYTPNGEPVFTSRKQRRDFLKAHGRIDRDGGFGDG